VSEATGPVCPECGTPRAADGTPACSCAQRASDAHRETRAAQAAAAEDFDPLRIRPFVKVGDDTGTQEPTPSAEADVDADAPTAPLDLHRPMTAPADEPPPDDGTQDGRRPRRGAWTAGAAVGAAVLVTGGLVAGLLSYRSPSRDGSGPDEVRASVPADASGDGTPSAEPSRTASSPTPSATPSSSPSASPAERETASDSPPRTGPSSGTGATATSSPAPSGPAGQNPVLRPGDKGPEVVELQLRLRQIGFYDDDADGDYDSQVENAVRSYQFTRVILTDESGVYGHATRASLEAETSEP
jgi:hypothetical protein